MHHSLVSNITRFLLVITSNILLLILCALLTIHTKRKTDTIFSADTDISYIKKSNWGPPRPDVDVIVQNKYIHCTMPQDVMATISCCHGWSMDGVGAEKYLPSIKKSFTFMVGWEWDITSIFRISIIDYIFYIQSQLKSFQTLSAWNNFAWRH